MDGSQAAADFPCNNAPPLQQLWDDVVHLQVKFRVLSTCRKEAAGAIGGGPIVHRSLGERTLCISQGILLFF